MTDIPTSGQGEPALGPGPPGNGTDSSCLQRSMIDARRPKMKIISAGVSGRIVTMSIRDEDLPYERPLSAGSLAVKLDRRHGERRESCADLASRGCTRNSSGVGCRWVRGKKKPEETTVVCCSRSLRRATSGFMIEVLLISKTVARNLAVGHRDSGGVFVPCCSR